MIVDHDVLLKGPVFHLNNGVLLFIDLLVVWNGGVDFPVVRNRRLVVDRLANHQPGGGEADGFSGQSWRLRRCGHGGRRWRR